MGFMTFGLFGLLAALVGVALFLALCFRRVVPANQVHIVQSANKTISYGTATGKGNTYYQWPSWIPFLGVITSKLPVDNFNIELDGYEAFDKDRVPFVVDVMAFFRISDTNTAAQRVASFEHLTEQLTNVVRGAIRVVLANNSLEEILSGRSTLGEQFTREVNQHLAEWGVTAVQNVEIMDIRDAKESKVISNIMEKKKSQIEMESRTEVAKNKKTAQIAEIEAQREVDLQKQQASQSVGLRTIEAEREVELQRQAKLQTVKEQERLTKDKEMNVLKVEQLRKAEIQREVEVVKAEQNRQTTVLAAQAQKETAVLAAEGQLESKKREAEGIALEGAARAEAEKALQLAPVQAQITLAKEIGSNESYQKYLITVKQVEAQQAVGMEQAKALKEAEIKVIANTGNAANGLTSVTDIFSSKGGTEIGAMLEGLANTDTGQKLLNKFVGTKPVSNGKSNGAAHS